MPPIDSPRPDSEPPTRPSYGSATTKRTRTPAALLGIPHDHVTELEERGYRILEQAKEGGQGVIYVGEGHRSRDHDSDIALGVFRVAIKSIYIPEDPADAEKAIQRFNTEIAAMTRLGRADFDECDYILPIYDVIETKDGTRYLIEKLIIEEWTPEGKVILGETLTRKFERLHRKEEINGLHGKEAFQCCLNWFLEFCEGIQYCHKKGVIHRDVKPSNVLISRNGRPYVTDFGCALIDEEKARHSMPMEVTETDPATDTGSFSTRASDSIGTPGYVSPEQAKAGEEVDERTDVYALGATLYHMLSGTSPFAIDIAKGDTRAFLRKDAAFPRNRGAFRIPEDLARIAMKALSRNREDRYPSVEAMIEDIKLYQAQRPTSVNHGPQRRLLLTIQRNIKSILSNGFTVAVISGILYISKQQQTERQTNFAARGYQRAMGNLRGDHYGVALGELQSINEYFGLSDGDRKVVSQSQSVAFQIFQAYEAIRALIKKSEIGLPEEDRINNPKMIRDIKKVIEKIDLFEKIINTGENKKKLQPKQIDALLEQRSYFEERLALRLLLPQQPGKKVSKRKRKEAFELLKESNSYAGILLRREIARLNGDQENQKKEEKRLAVTDMTAPCDCYISGLVSQYLHNDLKRAERAYRAALQMEPDYLSALKQIAQITKK